MWPAPAITMSRWKSQSADDESDEAGGSGEESAFGEQFGGRGANGPALRNDYWLVFVAFGFGFQKSGDTLATSSGGLLSSGLMRMIFVSADSTFSELPF